MAIDIALPAEYAYVVFVLVASVIVHHIYMPFSVVKARKKYGVSYPDLYADKASNKEAEKFNCVQRGHQNSLENYPQFLACLLVGGLKFPISAAIAGTVYLLGRVLYFAGYATGNPKSRLRGAFFNFAMLFFYGLLITMGIQLLKNASWVAVHHPSQKDSPF